MTQEAKKEALPSLNGLETRVRGKVIFVPLPRALWQTFHPKADGQPSGCACAYCSADGHEAIGGAWDTLAVSVAGGCTWMVHAPEMHGQKPVRELDVRHERVRLASAGGGS